jgi:putative phosphoribosyl transferase
MTTLQQWISGRRGAKDAPIPLRPKEIPFRDRTDAGRQIAEKLMPYIAEDPLILALPRGGVPVAYEVAKKLGAPLDTVPARKIGSPRSPQFAVGAIAPGGVLILDEASLQMAGLTQQDVAPVIEVEKREMERREARFQSGRRSAGHSAGTVILVDDGLATGMTATAAVESVMKTLKPRKVIFAAPICARDTVELLNAIVDEVICVHMIDDLVAIGYWYKRFEQISDEEVLRYIKKAG